MESKAETDPDDDDDLHEPNFVGLSYIFERAKPSRIHNLPKRFFVVTIVTTNRNSHDGKK